MIDPNGREIILRADQDMLTLEDIEGEEPIFYHSGSNVGGCVLEAKRRRELKAYLAEHLEAKRYWGLRAYFEENDMPALLEDRRNAEDCILPVTNTVDALGILKGDVEFSPTYKRFGDITEDDERLTLELMQSFADLMRDELTRIEADDPDLPL